MLEQLMTKTTIAMHLGFIGLSSHDFAIKLYKLKPPVLCLSLCLLLTAFNKATSVPKLSDLM
ncbi:MAG: hypothetical protein ACJASU_000402 [Cognaticolwellia sp.]|jgi:hypothetical protein